MEFRMSLFWRIHFVEEIQVLSKANGCLLQGIRKHLSKVSTLKEGDEDKEAFLQSLRL